MKDLDKIFREVFVDGAGEIYNCIAVHKTAIKKAMELYAECEVKKLSKGGVISSVCEHDFRPLGEPNMSPVKCSKCNEVRD